ncbi:DUF6415 family natural product biosynthesis protein [Streptomyces olivoreticuli]
MFTRTLRPDSARYQPQCALPPWSSNALLDVGDPRSLGHLLGRLVAYRDLFEVADSDATHDLLEQVLGEHTTPSPAEIEALTQGLVSVLDRMVGHASLLHSRQPGPQARQTIQRARSLLEERTTTTPTLASLRRLVHTAQAVLDLAGEDP